MSSQRFWRSPALPFAESRSARDSRACYALHTHPGISIGTVDAGRSVFTCDQRQQALGRGDVVLIPAGAVHACNPAPDQAWAYQMLTLDETWLQDVVGEMGQLDAVALTQTSAARAPQSIHAALTHLNASLFGNDETPDKEAALIHFAGDVFGPLKAVHTSAGLELAPARLAHIKALIVARCTEPLPLALLASTAGLSRYHFVRAFRRAVGMTPHAWQLDARINQARALLDQGMPLTELALHLGFADQSHFQRAFKQRVAVTPRQYQRNFLQELSR